MSIPIDKALRRVMATDERCGVPMCIYWNTQELADWVVEIGYPQYRDCFESNFITGFDLIGLDASALPDIGIQDFEHIKAITAEVRELLGLKQIIKNMNVAMGDPMIAYLDQKRRTGRLTQNTSFQTFQSKNRRWFRNKK